MRCAADALGRSVMTARHTHFSHARADCIHLSSPQTTTRDHGVALVHAMYRSPAIARPGFANFNHVWGGGTCWARQDASQALHYAVCDWLTR